MRLPVTETVASQYKRRAGITPGIPGRKESDCMKVKIINCDNDHADEFELTQNQWRELRRFAKNLKDLPPLDYRRIADSFNQTCTKLTPVKNLTSNRKRIIARAVRDGYDLEQLFHIVAQSSFMAGKNKLNWRATFDWILDPEHIAKVAEGQYSDSIPAPVPSAPPMSGNPFDDYG